MAQKGLAYLNIYRGKDECAAAFTSLKYSLQLLFLFSSATLNRNVISVITPRLSGEVEIALTCITNSQKTSTNV